MVDSSSFLSDERWSREKMNLFFDLDWMAAAEGERDWTNDSRRWRLVL